MSSITWSQIESECGNFRDGFVATFRKYEGQDTDERDGQNRAVKVTMASFARHVAIPETTFKQWVWGGKSPYDAPPERLAQRDVSLARSNARRLPPGEKAKLVAELMADPEVADEIADEITTFVASDPVRTAHVISKRRDAAPPPVQADQPKPVRDYDAMVEQWVNLASVTFAAESAGTWKPNEHSEALLYFISQIVGKRSEPTGETADFVNAKLDSLFAEAEAYANSEVS
jgi:hypothetical protein